MSKRKTYFVVETDRKVGGTIRQTRFLMADDDFRLGNEKFGYRTVSQVAKKTRTSLETEAGETYTVHSDWSLTKVS